MSVTTAEALIADLRAALPGDLAPFSQGLLAAVPDKGLRFDDLLSPQQSTEIMNWLEARLGARPDWRAAFSIWAGWHFRSVLPSLIAANILLDVSPRLDLDNVRFVISADLRAERIVIPALLDDLSNDDGPTRFAGIVDTYLTPLISRLGERTRLTKRVLWSNAGNVFEGFLRMLEPAAQGRSAVGAAHQLLTTAHLPSGDRNPLFEPVRYIEGKRIRRVCCMRYLFPDGKTCNACPLDLESNRSARLHLSGRCP